MNIAPFLQWVYDTPLGEVTRELPWLFTAGLVIHFVGMCLLFGSMLIVDLRLLGYVSEIPLRSALAFLPWAVFGFVLNLCTGIMFFTLDPFQYAANPALKIKLVLLFIAGCNALWFILLERGKLHRLREDVKPDLAVRICAGLSLALWIAVILFGRLIVAFQGSSDLF